MNIFTLQKAAATIRDARPEEVLEVAMKLAVLMVQARIGGNHPPDLYEQAAMVLIGGYLDQARSSKERTVN